MSVSTLCMLAQYFAARNAFFLSMLVVVGAVVNAPVSLNPKHEVGVLHTLVMKYQ
jgi:hypothetical protein